ncbi:MAG: T9SS type A sorting domain-containing protein [bacterium]
MPRQKIKTLIKKSLIAQHYQINWNFEDDNNKKLPAGIYLLRAAIGTKTFTKKIVKINP